MAQNPILRTLVATGLLLAAVQIPAATLEPDLQEAIEDLGPGDSVDLIVRCTDKVKVKDFKDRDKKVRRDKLIRALKEKASACQNSLRHLLDEPVTLLWAINGFAVTLPDKMVEQLLQRPGVESIRLDAEVVAPAGSAGGPATPEWNIDMIRAPELWDLGHDGTGVVVATLDTGVDPDHPDIGPKWRGGANSWFDPNGQHASPYDASGHGTGVMGLIVGGDAGGTAIGVAPGAQWIAVKIFKDNGQSQLSKIHQGFQWVLDPDDNPSVDDAADIVNDSWYLQNTVDECNTEFADDIAVLKAAEIAVVFSAGNTGPNSNSSVSPSNDRQSLAVGAVDASQTVGGFSGRGPSACDGGIYPHIAAPGVSVWTADRTFGGIFPDSYIAVSGTSFSAPHLAGGMAVLQGAMEAEGVPVTVSMLELALTETAVDLGSPGPDNGYGAGLPDLVEAHAWLLANAGSPQPGQLQFSEAAYSVDENGGSITLTVTRTDGSAGDVTIDYATADGTAAAGADYESTFGMLSFLEGETSQTFTVTILDDPLVEGDESLMVALSNPTGGAALGSPDMASVTILEDDSPLVPGDLQFDAASYSVAEGDGSVSVTVTRTGGSDGVVSVDYATGDGTATEGDDYVASAGILTFADGDASESFTVTILDDAIEEGEENFTLALSNPTGGAGIGTPGAASVSITDDDAPSDDADGDGYLSGVDCNDNDPTVHPGAPEIKHDGIDQDCNGYDLTIVITKFQYNGAQDRLVVEAKSDLGAAAGLVLQDYGPMSWNGKKGRWSITVNGAGGDPGTATVSGVEGSESS